MARCGVPLIILAALLAGCSKRTAANYDKLKVGMGYNKVVSILGKPDTCLDTLGTKGCTWGNEQKNITITFLRNKVILYQSKNIK
jgi:hypothetical protein